MRFQTLFSENNPSSNYMELEKADVISLIIVNIIYNKITTELVMWIFHRDVKIITTEEY